MSEVMKSNTQYLIQNVGEMFNARLSDPFDLEEVLYRVKIDLYLKVLMMNYGNISKAAAYLNMSRTTLTETLKANGLNDELAMIRARFRTIPKTQDQ